MQITGQLSAWPVKLLEPRMAEAAGYFNQAAQRRKRWLEFLLTDPFTGTAVGNAGSVLRTTDAGDTWINHSPTTTALLAVSFIDADVGWISGYGGEIWRTTDGGSNWVLQYSQGFAGFFGISFTDANNVTGRWAGS